MNVREGRIDVTDWHTHTHTDTQDNYRNPRACAPRVNKSRGHATVIVKVAIWLHHHTHITGMIHRDTHHRYDTSIYYIDTHHRYNTSGHTHNQINPGKCRLEKDIFIIVWVGKYVWTYGLFHSAIDVTLYIQLMHVHLIPKVLESMGSNKSLDNNKMYMDNILTFSVII